MNGPVTVRIKNCKYVKNVLYREYTYSYNIPFSYYQMVVKNGKIVLVSQFRLKNKLGKTNKDYFVIYKKSYMHICVLINEIETVGINTTPLFTNLAKRVFNHIVWIYRHIKSENLRSIRLKLN